MLSRSPSALSLSGIRRYPIYILIIFDKYTSKRTLVMEWIDGIKITNTAELISKGHNTRDIL